MTSKLTPRPKLRVTFRSCTPFCPQLAHDSSGKVDGDDNELAGGTELDDRLGRRSGEGGAGYDAFNFSGLSVTLPLDDFAREDDAFEVEDREIVIVKFLRSVNGDDVVQGTNEVSKLADGWMLHVWILISRYAFQRKTPSTVCGVVPFRMWSSCIGRLWIKRCRQRSWTKALDNALGFPISYNNMLAQVTAA
jgi:hypothetical protein